MHKMSAAELKDLQEEMKFCQQCLDKGYQITPGAIFSGDVSAEIMLVGQAPGITEVSTGRPFNAGSGKRLFEWLARIGFTETGFRKRQYMTAVTKCFPGKNASGRGDRVPSREEQQLCRNFLIKELTLVSPSIILPVGKLAIDLFLNKPRRLTDVVGQVFWWTTELDNQLQEPGHGNLLKLSTLPKTLPSGGRWIVPLPHPSGASLWPNRPENKQLISRSVDLIYELASKLEIRQE
jgi:uracil-DNA glycosylase